MEVSPNSSNVIPGRVRFSIDLRHPTASGLEVVAKKLSDQLEAIAKRSIVNYNYRVVHQADDVEMDSKLIDCLSESCVKQQESAVRIYSGAGHDSMKIAQVCPVGMLAVRCRGGLSHHPDEYASDEDCLAAFRTMLDAVLTLDKSA
jgi:allantoate deiminase